MRTLVVEIVGDDARFEVIGWDDNLGFYLNSERLLMAVPDGASWVALSDQDDRWYPEKLEDASARLASASDRQARVITGGSRNGRSTQRRSVPASDLLLQNQVTGALSVLRRRLLDLALPFPRHPGATEMHDHWLAMCAAATHLGYAVLDEVVQDYVQHGGNIVGEGGLWLTHSRRSFGRLTASMRDQSTKRGTLVALRDATIGWRATMLDTLWTAGKT